MSQTSLETSSSGCHATNSAPWLFSDPYAYQYADIPEHIRLIGDAAAREKPSGDTVSGNKEKPAVAAVEAGSLPVFEMEGCAPTTVKPPTVTVVGEKGEKAPPNIRFELQGCSGLDGGGGRRLNPVRLTITPSGPMTGPGASGVASPLTPGCLQVGGGGPKSPLSPGRAVGEGLELFLAPTASAPSTPTSPAGGLLRRSTANRRSKVPACHIPAGLEVVEVRCDTAPPPYSSGRPPSNSPTAPLSALPPHLRHHKRPSQSVSSIPHTAPPPSRPSSPAPASDLDSILRNIDDDRRCKRDSVLIAEMDERRRGGSRGTRAYWKYCDNN